MTPLPPLSALRALAEAATPGPWKDESEARSGNWCRVFSGEKYGAGQTIAQWTMPADARYIAAFSPSTTLALLACAAVAALPVLAYVRGERDWRDWQRGRDLMRSQP